MAQIPFISSLTVISWIVDFVDVRLQV